MLIDLKKSVESVRALHGHDAVDVTDQLSQSKHFSPVFQIDTDQTKITTLLVIEISLLDQTIDVTHGNYLEKRKLLIGGDQLYRFPVGVCPLILFDLKQAINGF